MNFGAGREVDHHTPYGDQPRQKAEVHFGTGSGNGDACTIHGEEVVPSDHHRYSPDIECQYIHFRQKPNRMCWSIRTYRGSFVGL